MAASAKGGLAFAVASAATFSTSGTFASALLAAGWSPVAAVTIRIAVSALILTVPAILAMHGRSVGAGWSLLRTEWRRVVSYGFVAVAGCQLCYFEALQRLPVGIALLLEYLGTVLVVAWMWLRHGQRPRRLTVAGGCIALTGLTMMLGVAGAGRISIVGVVWGLLAAACLAVYFTLSSGESELPPIVTAWGGMCFGTLLLLAAGLSGLVPLHARLTDVVLLGHKVTWIVPVLGLSLVASAFAYVAGIAAAQRLGARLASFAGLSEVMFAVLFAWIFLGQLPAAEQFAGGGLILSGVVLLRLGEQRLGEQGDQARRSAPAPAPAPASQTGTKVASDA